MTDITINNRSFSERLLTPDGVTRLNRARRELFTFEPVGDTCQVRLSDQDGEVSRFLNVDTDSILNEGIFQTSPDNRVVIAQDGVEIFRGYIAPASCHRVHLDWENLDDEAILEFSLVDDTVHLFNQLSTRRVLLNTSGRNAIGGLVRAVLPEVTMHPYWQYYVGVNYEFYAAPLDKLMEALAGVPVSLSPEYQGLYVNVQLIQKLGESERPTGRDFGVMRGGRQKEERTGRPITAGEIIIDLATAFLATLKVNESGTLEFLSVQAIPATPHALVEPMRRFESPNNEGLGVDYAQDMRLKVGDPTKYEFLVEDVYYRWDEAGAFIETTEEPVGGSSAMIAPVYYTMLETQDLKNLFVHVSGQSPTGWERTMFELTASKKRMIRDFLSPRAPFRVRTVGWDFLVGQRCMVNGYAGYVIREANLEPMTGEAELILEYRPPVWNVLAD